MLPMAKRARATKAHVTVRINIQSLARLDKLAERLSRTRSELIDRAVEELVERHEPRPIEQHKPRGR
jgi:predicted transcriptional regulator